LRSSSTRASKPLEMMLIRLATTMIPLTVTTSSTARNPTP
jgi:hypothetical protein